MKKFIAGFLAGLVVAGSASVFAAKMVGNNGYLNGWEVRKDGEEICSDPYIYISSREIECN